MHEQDREDILVYSPQDELQELLGRLLLNHFRGRVAHDLEEAERTVKENSPTIHAGIVPANLSLPSLGADLARLRQSARSSRLEFVVAGPRPSEDALAQMRAAGIDYTLFEPSGDTELRFVLNQATHDSVGGDRRDDLRVPTSLVARVHSPAGTKMALVYSLSKTGAYLETPRPSQESALVEVEIPIPAGTLTLNATVVSTNVTGNLRRENLPRGMGIRFEGLDEQEKLQLKAYIDDRAACYRP
ncbi:MAG: PilZ domain-containing protein [Myxococcales bacterium]|nr:PilZ domain-containing protein [Myxococcales bacterium]